MKKTLISAVLLLLSTTLLAQKPLDLSEMNESEKNKTGLYKLSESEIKALENWLNTKQKAITRVEQQSNAGFESKKEANRDNIESTLEKMYKDPLGNTYYKLTNGQVWKQIQSGNMNFKNGVSQPITIEPKLMGSWILKGNGNRGVKVKRIR